MSTAAGSVDIVVVGAGIVGASVALRLAGDGRRVALVAPEAAGAATPAAGAMLGVLGEVTREPESARERLDLELRLRAGSLWPAWHASLAERCDVPPLREGTFMTAPASRPADLDALRAVEAVAAAHGLHAERAEAADVPGLSPVAGHQPLATLFLGQERWVDARAAHRAVLAAAAGTGRVTRVVDEVTEITASGDGRLTGVATSRSGPIGAPQVVVCAGAWTGELLARSPAAGSRIPAILPAKGVALRLEPPPRLLEPSRFRLPVRTPNRQFACGLHLLPQGDGIYLGATNRVTRWPGITGAVTAGEIVGLVGSARRELFHDLHRWNLTEATYGERPLAVDGMPVVGATEVEGLLVATGTYRNGLLLAPLVADLVASEVSGGEGLPAIGARAGRSVATPPPASVLAEGLREFAELIRDPDTPATQPALELLLGTLGRLVLEEGPAVDELRVQVRDLLASIPLVELVPEALIELCHPEFLP